MLGTPSKAVKREVLDRVGLPDPSDSSSSSGESLPSEVGLPEPPSPPPNAQEEFEKALEQGVQQCRFVAAFACLCVVLFSLQRVSPQH